VASNAAAASKAAEITKAARAAAPGMLGDYRTLGYVTPFTFNAQVKEQLEAGKAEVTLKGLWHKAKPRGLYGPKGKGRWPPHLKEMARIVLQEWGQNSDQHQPPPAAHPASTVCLFAHSPLSCVLPISRYSNFFERLPWQALCDWKMEGCKVEPGLVC
jgi:hypothetical protein